MALPYKIDGLGLVHHEGAEVGVEDGTPGFEIDNSESGEIGDLVSPEVRSCLGKSNIVPQLERDIKHTRYDYDY